MARLKRESAALGDGPVSFIRLGSGDRPPVMLLHGLAADALTWQFNLSALARSRPVVAVDLPGHGGSELPARGHDLDSLAAWLEEVLQALAPQGAHVVGHSFGGLIAYRGAFRRPRQVRSLTLVASAGLGRVFNQPLVESLVTATDSTAILAVARQLAGHDTAYAELLARALATSAADGRRDLRPLLDTITRQFAQGARPDWRQLPMPIQLVWDPADPVIPPPPPEWRPPGARLHLLENTGHLPHAVAASRFNILLADFLTACDQDSPEG